ncbi:MAG TPA: hypothetical protein VFW52_01585 [Candidatus Saccharimonadales bacterium]|nr:hypothetical protein [Candidatus Saccharimonadales bacterium]
MASPSESAKPTAEPLPQFIIGGKEDQIVDESLDVSESTAQLLKDAGLNAVEMTAPWTYPRQCAEINNDLNRYRNAFTALKDKDLLPILNLIPGGGAGMGKAPTSPSQQRCYKDTLISYLHLFAEVNPGGNIVFEVPNEPNYKLFWKPQENAPKAVVSTLEKVYKPVKAEADGLGVSATIIGGGLGAKQAAGFTKEMGDARRESSYQGPIMDGFSLHPYGLVNNESPDTTHPGMPAVGLGDLPAFESLLDKTFQKPMPIWLTEYGAKVKVPDEQKAEYDNIEQTANGLISQTEQAKNYAKAIRIARCNRRVSALIFFNPIDDRQMHPDGGWWTSGLYTPNGTPKPALAVVQTEANQSKVDRFANC